MRCLMDGEAQHQVAFVCFARESSRQIREGKPSGEFEGKEVQRQRKKTQKLAERTSRAQTVSKHWHGVQAHV